MNGLTVWERLALEQLKRDIAAGKRSEQLPKQEEGRCTHGHACDCGRSDGQTCHCSDDDFRTNYG